MYLGNIGVEDEWGFRKVGKLYWSDTANAASVQLFAYPLNDCVCKTEVEKPPYIEGDMYIGEAPRHTFIGSVNTADDERGVLYFFRWWALPKGDEMIGVSCV